MSAEQDWEADQGGGSHHLKDVGSAQVNNLTAGTSVISDPTGLLVPGVQGTSIHVSPTGNDSHDGTTEQTAVLTPYVGYQKIVAKGGGRLVLADGLTAWGGPVPHQGLWIRGDGANIPGWLPSVACIIEGSGQTTQTLFERPGQVACPGGSNLDADFRNKPGIWLSCIENASITFKNIKPVPAAGAETFGQIHYLPWRVGVDFNRNSSDGSIQYLQITSSARSAGVSTHAVTLPAGVAIQSATRTSGVVHVTIPRPAGLASFPPWKNSVPVWIESSDPTNFPSGAFVVKLGVANIDNQADWSFSYDQAGTDHTTANMGVVRSALTKVGDFIDLESSSAQFPSTRYRVSAVSVTGATAGTIAVTDIFGGHNGVNATQGATANIGQLSHEERSFSRVLGPTYDNCSNYMVNDDGIGLYKFGPAWDLGCSVAIQHSAYQCAFYGYFPSPGSGVPWDEDRQCAVLVEGDEADASLFTSDCSGSQAEVRIITGNGQSQHTLDFLFDTSTGYAPPPYHMTGNNGVSTSLRVINADAADAVDGYGIPIVEGMPPLSIEGPVPVGISAVGPSANPIGRANAWSSGIYAENPWVNLQVGTWADLRTTGKHPAAQRNLSPVNCRFQNLVMAPGSWVNKTVGSGITAGIDDPFGGTLAYRIDSTSGTTPGDSGVVLRSTTDTFFEPGGYLVVAGWFRVNNAAAGKAYQPSLIAATSFSNAVFDSAVPTAPRWPWPAYLDGWHWWSFSARMLSGPASQAYVIGFTGAPLGSGLFVDFFAPTFEWIPASVGDNDASEYIGTLRATPRYLTPGMAGTWDGQGFIAHGGIGVDASVLTTPSGTGSPTKNMPLLDASGVTQGYIPVLPTDSELPVGTVTSVGNAAPITSSGGATPTIGITDFVASGASHARGSVPDPGAVAGTTKFLREDATFAVPPVTALDGKIWVDATDAAHNARDYLYNKLTSFTGTLSFAPTGTNDAQLTIDTVYKPNKIISYYVLTSIPGSAGGWLATSVSTGFSALFAVIEYALLEAMIAIQVDVVVSKNTITGTGTTDIDFVSTQNGTLGSIGGTVPYGSTGVFSSGKVTVAGTATSDTWGVAALNHGTVTGGTLTATIVLTAFY